MTVAFHNQTSTAAGTMTVSSCLEDPAFLAGFVAEAREHLDTAESGLLSLESHTDDTDALNTVFRAFHSIKGAASFLGLNEIRELAHETESVLDAARGTTAPVPPDHLNLAMLALDALRTMVASLSAALKQGAKVSLEMPDALLRSLREVLGAAHGDEGAHPAAASKPDAAPQTPLPSPSRLGPHNGETVRVDAARLDRLLDTIGELVVTEAIVSDNPELRTKPGSSLQTSLRRLDKVTRELRDIGTSLRMVPLRATFQKMTRAARDLSRQLDKPIEMTVEGEDVEVDRALVERIADPLLHLIRNTIDHGLEDPSERGQRGKPREGRLTLRAFHHGDSIHIEVSDDGRGLHSDAILARAREQGLVAQDALLTEAQTHALIFRPGFSTSETVTDVSGRGVGLDVVKRNVEALQGRVDVSSQAGAGTTFSLRLPLTLAIIDGLLVRCGGDRYVLPAQSVAQALNPAPTDIHVLPSQEKVLDCHGHMFPLCELTAVIGGTPQEADGVPLAVIIEDEGRQVAVLVDEVLGKQQFVIKNLDFADRSSVVSGCAILSDGTVGLILSPSTIVAAPHACRPPEAARQPGAVTS